MNPHELIIDSFAGGGGASLGIALAVGRSPDIAINHKPAAIAVHAANHPETLHLTEDVWKAAPRQVTRGRPVGLLWCSPDCTHHSRAKGGKPVKKEIRSLAWVAIKWAVEAQPRVIILENVREFEQWGPIVPRWICAACAWKGTEGQTVLARTRRRCPRCESLRLRVTADLVPDPARMGLTFRRFVGRLRNLGYAVAWRTLNAADYGAPTHRRRLFLVARRDGLPIAWPEPTHGDPAKVKEPSLFAEPLQPWRTAAECIDWTLPCPSIFSRKRPLAEATMRRIALGVQRYVLDNPRPFIVTYYGAKSETEFRGAEVGEPLRTQGAENRFGLLTPYLVRCNHAGPEFRGQSVECPVCTLTASRDAHGMVTPLLVPLVLTNTTDNPPTAIDAPLKTATTGNHHYLIAPTLIQTGYGERAGQEPRVPGLDKPLGTCVNGQKHAVVAAFIAKHFGGAVGTRVETPLPTTTARGTQNQLVTANLVRFNHDDAGVPIDQPLPTVTGQGNHAGIVYSFLTKYYRTAIGQHPAEPLHVVTDKDRFGLVCVTIAGEPYVIVDIGMRMLTPRELARCQGFPDSYRLPGEQLAGTKSAAVAMIGNSVSPQPAAALVRANYTEAAAACA